MFEDENDESYSNAEGEGEEHAGHCADIEGLRLVDVGGHSEAREFAIPFVF